MCFESKADHCEHLGLDKEVKASENYLTLYLEFPQRGFLCRDEIWLLKVELAERRPLYNTITCRKFEIIMLLLICPINEHSTH